MASNSKAMQEVQAIVEVIVEKGGRILAEKDLQRHLIHNAWEVTKEVTCSHLQMCFVPHDSNPMQDSLWMVEDEPPAPPSDIWLRKQLEVLDGRALQATATPNSPSLRRKTRAKVCVPSRLVNRRMSMLEYRSRVMPLSDSLKLDERDEDDEAFRQLWANRCARATRAEQAPEDPEEAQRRMRELQAWQREMGYTSGAGLTDRSTTLEETDRLPKMNNSIVFDITSAKASPREPEAKAVRGVTIASQESVQSHEVPQPRQPEEVVDGFVRLEDGQPSPLKTMRLQPGVVLECSGRTKSGPRSPNDPNHKAWKVYQGWIPEYSSHDQDVQSLSIDLDAMDLYHVSVDGAQEHLSPSLEELQVPRAEGCRPKSAHLLGRSESLASFPSRSTLLSANCWGQGRSAAAKVPGLKAPSASPAHKDSCSTAPRRSASQTPRSPGTHPLRSQPRNPRQKVALLGGHCGALVQPPLGATMGHGLLPSADCNMREAIKKGEFYYPTSQKDKPVLRASSLSRTRSAQSVQRKPTRAWK
ncbi:unnamed protein product [Effrenium voratum]|nr:unnamed protein product [Effrenium voratum]